MIYSYGLKNYFGFKEGAEVSFALNSKVPKEFSMGRDFTTILGVKGANGAGKTNLLKAIGFLSSFCARSFNNSEGDKITADPYFSNGKPSEFYIDFCIEETRYVYELGVTRDEVMYERLYRKNVANKSANTRTRKVLVFDRVKEKIVKRLEELSSIDLIVLKKNASLISTAYNYKFPVPLEILNDLYRFFIGIVTNVNYLGLKDLELTSDNIEKISEFYINNEVAFNFAKNIIITSDLGISDIHIRERINDAGEKTYYPVFSHAIADYDVEFNLTSHDESSGTKSLYIKLYLYWLVLEYGGTLALDEFDLNCHPFILPKLLNLFESKETNKLGAQFIFTSHITEVLDKLGKYRTYLVNKESNESYCYRLDEIGGDILRNGRPISPLYNEGKIGGVPKL